MWNIYFVSVFLWFRFPFWSAFRFLCVCVSFVVLSLISGLLVQDNLLCRYMTIYAPRRNRVSHIQGCNYSFWPFFIGIYENLCRTYTQNVVNYNQFIRFYYIIDCIFLILDGQHYSRSAIETIKVGITKNSSVLFVGLYAFLVSQCHVFVCLARVPVPQDESILAPLLSCFRLRAG